MNIRSATILRSSPLRIVFRRHTHTSTTPLYACKFKLILPSCIRKVKLYWRTGILYAVVDPLIQRTRPACYKCCQFSYSRKGSTIITALLKILPRPSINPRSNNSLLSVLDEYSETKRDSLNQTTLAWRVKTRVFIFLST